MSNTDSSKESAESDYIVISEERSTSYMEQTDYEFEYNEISSIGLEAFENRAIQKVNDLADYIAIISDTSVNDEFSEQAKTMLLNMFDDNSQISINTNSNSDSIITIDLKEFIDAAEQNQLRGYKLLLSNIAISKPLLKMDNQLYNGKINGDLNTSVPLIIYSKTLPQSYYNAEIEFCVKKIDKNFGSINKKIWEVFLGDIHLRSTK